MLNRMFCFALSLMFLLANSGPVLADDDDVSPFAGSFLAQVVGLGPPAILFTFTSDGTAVVHGGQDGNGWWTQTGPLEISGVFINHSLIPPGSLSRAEFVQVYTEDFTRWEAAVCITEFPAGTGPSGPVFGPLPPLGPPTFDEPCDGFEATIIAERIGLPIDDDGDDDDDDDDDDDGDDDDDDDD